MGDPDPTMGFRVGAFLEEVQVNAFRDLQRTRPSTMSAIVTSVTTSAVSSAQASSTSVPFEAPFVAELAVVTVVLLLICSYVVQGLAQAARPGGQRTGWLLGAIRAPMMVAQFIIIIVFVDLVQRVL